MSGPLFGLTLATSALWMPTGPAAEPQRALVQLIAELDSDRYETRQTATRALILRGDEAIEPVAEAALSGSPETAVRAVAILEHVYTRADAHNDVGTLDRAGAALERLSEADDRLVAARAGGVLMLYGGIRERRAIAKVEELGGLIRYTDEDQIPGTVRVSPDNEPRIIARIILRETWTGGDEGLRYIAHLRDRFTFPPTIYRIAGDHVSDQGIRNLELEIPNLMLHVRGRACLGVSGTSGGEGCLVMQVQPDSAAERAGLQAEDVIVHFGGQPITDFEVLINRIAEFDPNEEVEVEVLRAGRSVSLKVVLDEWKKAY